VKIRIHDSNVEVRLARSESDELVGRFIIDSRREDVGVDTLLVSEVMTCR